VLTRLDYSNALLAGLPYSSVAPYQRVINVAVRLVNGLWPWPCHSSGDWFALVTGRSTYPVKLCLLVHHAVADRAPASPTSFNPSPPCHVVIERCDLQLPTVYTCHAPDCCLVSEPSESPLPRCAINSQKKLWKLICLQCFTICNSICSWIYHMLICLYLCTVLVSFQL